MRYKPKNIAALHVALGGLPDKMRVEVDPAPPSSVMNSRRPMPDMGGPSLRDYRTASLPPGRPLGLWARPELF
jgi:hypothetical protein